MQSKARKLYDEAIVIDGLNISNWDSPNVYAGLRAGNLTAISATVATWENFPQTMDHIAAWLRPFPPARRHPAGEEHSRHPHRQKK